MLEVRFISGNKFKIAEVTEILSSSNITVIPVDSKIVELQTEDTNKLVKEKALDAFYKIGRPLFVEHTGLYLEHMNGLPGGLTQIFWDNLGALRFSELFGNTSNPKVSAKTVIGFIDGKQFHYFEGSIDGIISSTPKGNTDFQWDCVFIPNGHEKTFSEMGTEKNSISMRKLALDKLSSFLNSRKKV